MGPTGLDPVNPLCDRTLEQSRNTLRAGHPRAMDRHSRMALSRFQRSRRAAPCDAQAAVGPGHISVTANTFSCDTMAETLRISNTLNTGQHEERVVMKVVTL